jgi:hypothetical protein
MNMERALLHPHSWCAFGCTRACPSEDLQQQLRHIRSVIEEKTAWSANEKQAVDINSNTCFLARDKAEAENEEHKDEM